MSREIRNLLGWLALVGGSVGGLFQYLDTRQALAAILSGLILLASAVPTRPVRAKPEND